MAIFIGENGILSMGNKTPVTILQENLQRQKITPHYELIYDGTGSNDPIFKYRVAALGHSAIGSGKSKKEAKHDAAAAYLQRTQPANALVENADVQVEGLVVASPYAHSLKDNFVGMLDGVCVVNKLPLAEHESISEVGPPHAKVFTMQCKVGRCSETATARTKKQAKHLVAKQMIDRIKTILGDKFIPYDEKVLNTLEDFDIKKNLKAIECNCCQPNLALKVNDIQDLFVSSEEECAMLPKVFLELPDKSENDLKHNSYDLLCNIVEEMGGTCKVIVPTETKIFEALSEANELFSRYSMFRDEIMETEHECSENESNNETEDLTVPPPSPEPTPCVATGSKHCENDHVGHFPVLNLNDSEGEIDPPPTRRCSYSCCKETDISISCKEGIPSATHLENMQNRIPKIEELLELTNLNDNENPDPLLEVTKKDSDNSSKEIPSDTHLGNMQHGNMKMEEQPSELKNISVNEKENPNPVLEEIEKDSNDSSKEIPSEHTQHVNPKEEQPAKLVRVFLRMICPQGTWSFVAVEDSYNKSVEKASFKALKFLSTMAMPTGKVKQ